VLAIVPVVMVGVQDNKLSAASTFKPKNWTVKKTANSKIFFIILLVLLFKIDEHLQMQSGICKFKEEFWLFIIDKTNEKYVYFK
jgi:hypothetical protein